MLVGEIKLVLLVLVCEVYDWILKLKCDVVMFDYYVCCVLCMY